MSTIRLVTTYAIVDHERRPEHGVVVGSLDRVERVVAEAGPLEDRLHDEHAGREQAELQSEHRHGRKERVAEHVPSEHART